MHIHTRNVNTAFRELVDLFYHEGHHIRVDPGTGKELETSVPILKEPSRQGGVLRVDGPVTITYSHPRERVLFNAARDANPFFHLYHALWLLAGRNDVAAPAYYVKKFMDFSDDGKTVNGSYGHRWRCGLHHPGVCTTVLDKPQEFDPDWKAVDQLDILVNHLRADPNSRRAVLQMWNVEDDLLKIGMPCNRCPESPAGTCPHCKNGMKMQSKDICCNLSVLFSIREEYREVRPPESKNPAMILGTAPVKLLDITVYNRSNDLVWGLLGEDYVTFTVLQEYMAARLGVEVGRYHHVSNNLHVYDWNWKPEQWLAIDDANPIDRYGDSFNTTTSDNKLFVTKRPQVLFPLIKDPAVFEKEVPLFVDMHKDERPADPSAFPDGISEPFLKDVAHPMLMAFHAHKHNRKHSLVSDVALDCASHIKADDWRIACISWLQRRRVKQ